MEKFFSQVLEMLTAECLQLAAPHREYKSLLIPTL
jgi:hypothetical protein